MQKGKHPLNQMSALKNNSAPSFYGLFAGLQLVLSEGRVFKWRTTEVTADDVSLKLKTCQYVGLVSFFEVKKLIGYQSQTTTVCRC